VTTDWLTDTFGLPGRTALVTGSRSGIGRATALALAQAGADLVLWARRPGDVTELAEQIRGLGRSAAVVGADLNDLAEVRSTADRLAARHRIDILVNNAGIIDRTPTVDVEMATWQRVLRVNLDAAFLVSRSIGAGMRDRGDGTIISIASLLSFQGGVGVASYTASKHAIAGLTKALANEWGADGVRVNAVAPGYVSTDNTEPLRTDPVREPQLRDRIPLGRWADPDEIAPAVVFLASTAARYVNGHLLVVDGGWLSR
jgi:2-deoxy-D-gluconate 3-dehydrogenase